MTELSQIGGHPGGIQRDGEFIRVGGKIHASGISSAVGKGDIGASSWDGCSLRGGIWLASWPDRSCWSCHSCPG